MEKATIVREIRRLATENGGVAPGQVKFANVTGISPGSWRGKYWRRWGEALLEAGFGENARSEARSSTALVLSLIALIRKNERFPTYTDLRMERNADEGFPGHMAFSRLGNREQRIKAVRTYVSQHSDYSDVLPYLPHELAKEATSELSEKSLDDRLDGFVYLVKLGKYYKIGKTFSVPRRHREIALELPEKPDVVHYFRTDDPSGIESYWHTRFANKRTNGEWFALGREDVLAFRKRKNFM